jgi:hypothetical protein
MKLSTPFFKRIISILFVIVFMFGGGLYVIWDHYRPNQQHVAADFGGLAKPIFYQGNLLPDSASGKQEGLKLPFTVVKELLDPGIVYEPQSQSVIITTKDKVVRLKTDQLTAMVNERPFAIRFPVESAGGKLYLPIEPLRQYYGIRLIESAESWSGKAIRSNGERCCRTRTKQANLCQCV